VTCGGQLPQARRRSPRVLRGDVGACDHFKQCVLRCGMVFSGPLQEATYKFTVIM